ncbi:MAG: mucoidy inhibitor MuiA family protein [Ktedonobacterales bacterium]
MMDYELATAIAGVTVYPDRALVVRHGEMTLDAAGEYALRIGGLPWGISRDSLRATGHGAAGMRIVGVEQAPEYHPAAPEQELARLRDAIVALEQSIAALDERKRMVEEQGGWLRTLGEQSARGLAWSMARGSAKPEDARGIFAYTAEETQRLSAARQDIQRERDDVNHTLEARRREYAELGGGQQPDRLAAIVRIAVATPGAITVELSYLVAGAGWRPRYDARIETQPPGLHLTQQALVTQHTSELWTQVALTLSTARPAAAQRLPDDPDPWYVDVFQPTPPPMPVVMASAMAAPMAAARSAVRRQPASFDAAAPDFMVEAELVPAEIERSGAAQLFHIPGGVDIPSDGSPHLVTLGEYDVPCQLDYVAMPVVAEGAHRRATARNTTGQVLLPGELHIFQAGPAGDEYAGATRLEMTAESAELVLYLGVDDNLTVKRELVERDTDKGSLLQSGVRRVTIGYRVTLGNRTGAPQRVTLKDRLPVPRNERIKLKVLDVKPQPAGRTRLEQLTWDVQLPPGEERRVEWRFLLESPADVEMTGLP